MTATMYIGDAIEVMGKLPEKSVDLVLTSPPFLALRSYLPADHPDKALEGGSQATPGEYIDWLVDVVEACDRVLAPHGSMCIELGDTYAGSGGAGGDYAKDGLREGQPTFRQRSGWHRSGNEETERYRALGATDTGSPNGGTGWPLAKSLSLIPELFRLTLVYGFNPLTGRQTERWRLRNVVRWVRPNPPVGALGDKFRPATSELMVFCKSAKRYFDLDAVREPSMTGDRVMRQTTPIQRPVAIRGPSDLEHDRLQANNPAGTPPLDWWKISEVSHLRQPCEHRDDKHPEGYYEPHLATKGFGDYTQAPVVFECSGGEFLETSPPPLDWWNIPPGGYEGAHYAVFPPELCIKPIKAMSPERVCKVCGEPSRRIVASESFYLNGEKTRGGRLANRAVDGLPNLGHGNATTTERTTLGFSDCGHDDWRSGVVLDPFGGSGTTAAVATGHGRDAILIDLDERNYELALDRVGPLVLTRGEVTA